VYNKNKFKEQNELRKDPIKSIFGQKGRRGE